jgi:hypothetical protein
MRYLLDTNVAAAWAGGKLGLPAAWASNSPQATS